MKKASIVVTGGDGGYGNLGDEALLESVKEFYHQYLEKFNVIILMANTPLTQNDGFVYVKDDIESWEKANINTKDIKLVHYYGGGYLNKYWFEEKIWLYRYLCEQGLSSKKVVFTGQGLGPFNEKQMTEIGDIAKNSAVFAMRDNAFQSPKTSFSFDETISRFSLWRLYPRRRKYINVHFRPGEAYSETEEKDIISKTNLITKFANKRGLKVRIFTMLYQEKERLEKILRGVEGIEIWDRPINFSELTSFLGRGYINISQSYHGVLASLYSGTPVIGIYSNDYYQSKYQGLKDILVSDLFTMAPIDKIEETNILELLKRNSFKNKLIRCLRLNNLKKQNHDVYKKIRSILNG